MTETHQHPYYIEGAQRDGPWVITCDHATNRVPAEICGGSLGLPQNDMNRHIAFDVGALGTARALGLLLDSPVIWSNFSRLVIDPNRGQDDPTLIMQLYDGTIIPGNRSVDGTERMRRIDTLYRPYHAALADLCSQRPEAALLSVHSFTPQLKGRPARPWEIGVLYAHDDRLSNALICELHQDQSLTVGINEPYLGHLPGDAVDQHALCTGRHNTLIELRNDLIAEHTAQCAWASRLAPYLQRGLTQCLGLQ